MTLELSESNQIQFTMDQPSKISVVDSEKVSEQKNEFLQIELSNNSTNTEESSKTPDFSPSSSIARAGDDENSRSSEEGIAESLKEAQRESERKAKREEAELRREALKRQEQETRAEMLKKLEHTMQQSSTYAQFLFNKLKAAPTPTKKSNRGRKRKGLSDLPSVAKKRTRRSAAMEPVVDTAQEEEDKPSHEDNKENTDTSLDNFHMPSLFTGGQLRDYQKAGVKWLSNLHFNGINGILADEMGLGKTIQVIAQICLLFEQGVQGPFLIVAPLSTVSNWESEFKRFSPKIPVVVYHGTKDERRARQLEMRKWNIWNSFQSYPVFITTYEIILRDTPFFMSPKGSHADFNNWSYFVIDEGHRMKNYQACLTKTLKQLNLDHRLILTGTPLQNDLSELWSLLNFILPEVFNNREWFQTFFDFSWIGSEEKAAIEKQGLVKGSFTFKQ